MTEVIDSYVGGSASGFDISIANKMLEDARQIVNFDKFSPSEDKHLIILGGQPAAGKSSIIGLNYRSGAKANWNHDFRQILNNFASFFKYYLPNYFPMYQLSI